MGDLSETSGIKALVLFTGLPGAGKSCVANSLVNTSKLYRFISIHFDDNLIFEDNGEYDVSYFSLIRNK